MPSRVAPPLEESRTIPTPQAVEPHPPQAGPNLSLDPEAVVRHILASDIAGRECDSDTVFPSGVGEGVPRITGEFWTSRQRQANALHEISYRACFKPPLVRYFVEAFTRPGHMVYDPFMGRGTTPLEAALLDRVPAGVDINPLSLVLTAPRLRPPRQVEVERRLESLHWTPREPLPEDLLTFYHPDTLGQLVALRSQLMEDSDRDEVDDWIRLVAVNRLTGHSPGFFSVYTMPPNQAVSLETQRKLNRERGQTPPFRNVPELIRRKSRALLADIDEPLRQRLWRRAGEGRLRIGDAESEGPPNGTVQLVVTSPPFLDVVDYATDNWLRCWFVGIHPRDVPITLLSRIEDWREKMCRVLMDLRRTLTPGGLIAFEVGEVRGGTVRLEEAVLAAGLTAGLRPVLVMVNRQEFTKTANCWGVSNNRKGTNTNRVVLFRKHE